MIHLVIKNKLHIILLIAVISGITSFIVISGWFFNITSVLEIVGENATMKFNTALLFLFTSCSLAITFKKKSILIILNKFIAFFIFLVGAISLSEYIFNYQSIIDTFFVRDSFSEYYPGRMSPATCVCFIIMSCCIWKIQTTNLVYQKTIQRGLLLIISFSLVSIFSFILQIPSKNKVLFFNTMALHTSILFLILSLAFSFKNSSIGLIGLFLGNQPGNKLFRFILPFITFLPLVLSYILLELLHNNYIEYDFGIVIYTVVFLILSILYISQVANRLNRSELNKKLLESSLTATNKELVQFKYALDESSIIVFTDEKGIINYVNDKFCEISQYSREELIGKTHALINSGYHGREFFSNLWKTIGQGNIWIGEIKNRAKDGSFYWVHTSIIPFKDENGKIYRHLAIRQDITKRKLSEEMFASQYVKKLEQKNKELEQFAYIASHDLQEPLRTITTFGELLYKKYYDQLGSDANKYLNFITKSTSRMRDLVKALLDYARIGGQKKLVKTDCLRLIKNIKEDMATYIDQTNTTLIIHPLPTVTAYKTEIRLLFQNLISNAIKFRKEDTAPIIHISSRKTGQYWEFAIEDNGIGIDEKFNHRIFEIFQRLHKQEDYEGTGIGLTHCQKIVSLHGGNIWVKSKLGEGSTFYFTLPIYNKEMLHSLLIPERIKNAIKES